MPRRQRPNPPNMRFYSGDHGGGAMSHHDIALIENTNLPAPPAEWSMFGMPCAINHIAIALPSREAWLRQLAYLQERGVKFDRRVEHGMTHSLYIHDPNGYGVELLYELPREVWEGDIDAALNFAEQVPTEGPEALQDRTEECRCSSNPLTVLRSAMAKRQSVNGSRARHENPIPNASRIGNIVMSSVIGGTNPGTRELPPTLEQQVANVFGYIRHDIEAAGGTVDDIIKITFWVKDPAKQRAALNDEWVKMFPDQDARPARHTQPLPADSRALVQADFVAVIA